MTYSPFPQPCFLAKQNGSITSTSSQTPNERTSYLQLRPSRNAQFLLKLCHCRPHRNQSSRRSLMLRQWRWTRAITQWTRKMVIAPLIFLMVATISNAEMAEEHPHFALLAYLAEVASVRDPLPEEPETVEDEVTHGSIEDILTAAAVAESMKEEIFFAEGADVTIDEDDEDVDIMTLPGGEADETMKEDYPAVTESENEPKDSDIISAPDHLENTTQGPHDLVETDDNASGTVLLQSQNEANVTVDTTAPIKSEIPIEDDQDEWESLISYSEAEDNTIEHPSANDRGAPSEQDTLPGGDVRETNKHPMVPSPNNTVGIDEMGQFAAPQFNFFEDPSEPDQPVVQTRLSLDNAAILPFPDRTKSRHLPSQAANLCPKAT